MKPHSPPKIALALLASAALVPGAFADQVILDDLIVDGSACVGLDCVNGESFGFDTIRLKENNLRIKFLDTSTAASFPTNDWQLTANDSANGGAEKFSIDDITNSRTPFTVEAGAPSHSLYVDDGGRLGLGTSTPVVDVHVKSGNTPTLRLEQDGTSGFTPQIWDVAGNEANFFVRDATSGSTLPFRVFPGAPSNALSIEGSTGDIGIGTTSPDAEVDIEGSSSENPSLRLTTASQAWEFEVNRNTGRFNLQDETGSNTPIKIDPGVANNAFSIGIDRDGNTDANTLSIGRNGGPAITLQVDGSVVVNGTTEHPDYVFGEDFELPSIEEQATFMWENKHLPSLPKAPEGLKGPVDLVGHQMGVLAELEKAHIYIEQLHKTIKELEARVEKLDSAK